MNKAEYDLELDKLHHDYRKAQLALGSKYALANNPVVVGDVVTDHQTRIRVTNISVYHDRPPCCVYTGIEIKKDGQPKTKQVNTKVYQCNMNEHIKQA